MPRAAEERHAKAAAQEEFSTVTDPVRVWDKAILLPDPFFDV